LIVQCDKCRTKYRVADEKVTGKGVRVRCAKCEHIFTVKPSAPPKAPASTPTPLDSPAHAAPPVDQTPPPPSEAATPSFEDPTFSDRPPGRTEDVFPHTDRLSITGLTTFDPSAPASTNGGMDWGNISMDGAERPDVDLTPAPDPSPGPDPLGPSVQSYSPEPDFPPEHPETEATKVELRHVAARPVKKRGKGLVFFLVLVLLGAGGYFAYPKISQLIGRVTGRIPAAKKGALTVKDSRFGSIKRSDGIILVTVRGVVMNNTGKKQGMIRITGEFKGADGEILATTASFCGNTFSDEDLNLMPMGKIRAALQNELGQSLNNSAVAPGKSVPFLLILESPAIGKIKEVTFKVENGLGNDGG